MPVSATRFGQCNAWQSPSHVDIVAYNAYRVFATLAAAAAKRAGPSPHPQPVGWRCGGLGGLGGWGRGGGVGRGACGGRGGRGGGPRGCIFFELFLHFFTFFLHFF